MTKIVINACYGGFGLSDAAMHAYAARKGKTLHPEKAGFLTTTYWTVPQEERVTVPTSQQWLKMTAAERADHNKKYNSQTIYDRDIPRDDPDLVAVVEELGKKAAGDYAALEVVEVPDGVVWEIAEYDGFEHVAEAHRTWG